MALLACGVSIAGPRRLATYHGMGFLWIWGAGVIFKGAGCWRVRQAET
jgi:hypothetical protein